MVVLEHDGVLLVPPSDDLVSELAQAACRPGAVLPPEREHYVTWLRGRTPEQRLREVVLNCATSTGDLDGPWRRVFLVLHDRRPVGVQRISSDGWPDRKVVYTSGWLLADAQSRGIGARARRAMLTWAFEECGAERAATHVLEENLPSRRISERLGYQVARRDEIEEDGLRMVELVYVLDREHWVS